MERRRQRDGPRAENEHVPFLALQCIHCMCICFASALRMHAILVCAAIIRVIVVHTHVGGSCCLRFRLFHNLWPVPIATFSRSRGAQCVPREWIREEMAADKRETRTRSSRVAQVHRRRTLCAIERLFTCKLETVKKRSRRPRIDTVTTISPENCTQSISIC